MNLLTSVIYASELFYCTGTEAPSVSDTISDRSTSLWIIIGICAGVILVIAIVAILLCLILLRKRKQNNKTL